MSKTIRAMLVKPDDAIEEVQLKRSNWVNHASELMDGAYIEPVNNIGGLIALLADEDGLQKGLPVNVAATSIATLFAGREVLPLVGPIIFTGVIQRGFPTDLTERISLKDE
jgi:hypothetical protein